MKTFYFFDDLLSYGPPWFSEIWPQMNATRDCLGALHIGRPSTRQSRKTMYSRKFDFWSDRRRYGEQIRQQVLNNQDPNEPNVLFVKALNGNDIFWASVLHSIWSVFDFSVLMIADTVQPSPLQRKIISRFDLITCFCGDLGMAYEDMFQLPVLYEPLHTDVLRYHSVSNYRPIDLIQVGRRKQEVHLPLHQHYNQLKKNRIFLDFVTRTQSPILPKNEFELLISTYAKSAISLCYDPSSMPRFRGRSPLTGRWVHAWAAGCTVLGERPTGSGVMEATDWPESIIELPDVSCDAINLIEELFLDEAGMERRRRRNVYEALSKHDTRYRLRDIFNVLKLPLPSGLERDLAQLDSLTRDVGAGL